MAGQHPVKRRVSAPLRTMFEYEETAARPFNQETERKLRDQLNAIDAAQQRADAASREAYIS